MTSPAEKLWLALTEAKQNAQLAQRSYGKIQALEVISAFLESFAGEVRKGAANPKAKKQSEMSDEEWVVSLEGEPSLKGINIRQEIGRAQFWCKQNKRVPTRRFLVNWLNKAEKVVDLKAMGAQHATGLKPPPPKGPEGWMQWLETELLSISQDHPAHGQLTAARNCQAFHLLPASWQARCLASHFTALPKQTEAEMSLRHA